ncbi:MAG: hypothetical protein RLZZ232_3687 [Planctomycetota bacterium]|jgi:hypothetical protein
MSASQDLQMFGQKFQPSWFFPSSGHLEAVSRLVYLVESREPAGVLCGPDGSGRTRVLERVCQELRHSGQQTISLNLAGLDDDAALWQLAGRLSSSVRSSMRRHELLAVLREELSGRVQCGLHTTVVLDDLHRAELNHGTFLRFLISSASTGSCPVSVLAALWGPIPEELSGHVYVPVRLDRFNGAESQVFVRELLRRLGIAPGQVEEAAVEAVSEAGRGLVARLRQICEIVQVFSEAWPEAVITEDIVRSLMTEIAPLSDESVHPRRTIRMA